MKQFWKSFLFYTFLAIRRLVYFCIFVFGTILPRNKVVILCYHSIGDDDWVYGVDMSTLKRQMLYMLSHYNPVTLDEIIEYIEGKTVFKKPVFAVTFDDGYADIMQTTEMFQYYGIRPTTFVISNTEKIDSNELGVNREFMSREEILKLRELGWTIGGHSATHTDFYSLTDDSAIREIVSSKIKLEESLGLPVKYFAYPKGRYTNTVISAFKKATYKAGFSMDDRIIRKGIDTRIIPRVGIDRTHTPLEFEATISLPAVYMRSVIKMLDKWNRLRKLEAHE